MSKYDSKPGGIGAHPNHEHAVHYRATIDAKPVQEEVKKVAEQFRKYYEEEKKYHQEGLKRDKEAFDSARRLNDEEKRIHSERIRRDREIIDSSKRREEAERDAVRKTIRSITDLNEARKEAGRAGDESAQSYLREFRRRIERDGRSVSKDVIREVAEDLKREFSKAGDESGNRLVQSFSSASRKVSESVKTLNDEITRAGRSTRKMGEEGEQSAERIRKSVARVRDDVKNLNDVMNRMTVKPVEFKADSAKLMRELDRVEDRLKKISDKDANVKIRATAEEAYREFDRVSNRLRQIDEDDATVDVTARVDDALRSADRVRDRFYRLREEAFTTVEVHAQIDDVIRKANEVSDRLRRIDTEDAEVDIRAVADQAFREISELQRLLERVDEESATIDVKVAKDQAIRELAFVKDRVEDLNRSAAEIDLKVSSAGAINAINIVRSMIREVDEEDADIDIDANIAPIMLKMQEVESRIQRIDEESATIDVNLEIDQARRASEEVLSIIRDMKDESASIPVRMQLEEWERGVSKVSGDLERIRNSSAQIRIDALTAEFNSKINEVQQKLNEVRESGAQPIEIRAVIDQAMASINTVEQRLLEIQAQPTSAEIDANIGAFLAKTTVVKSALSEIGASTTTARIVADADEAIEQITEFRQNTEAISNQPIVTRVSADTSSADSAVDDFVKRTVSRSGSAGRQSGVAFIEQLNRQLRSIGVPEIDLKANPNDALNDISTVKTELNRLVREAPTLELKLTYQNLLRQVEDVRRTVTREFEGLGRDSMYAMRREWNNSLSGLSRQLDSMTQKIWRLKIHTDPQGAIRGIQSIDIQMARLAERARILGERTGNEHATAISRRMAQLQQEMRRLPLEFYSNPIRFYRDLARVRSEIAKANSELKVVARAELDDKQFNETLRNVDQSVRAMDARAVVNIKVGVDKKQVNEATRVMFQLIQPDQQMANAMVQVFTRFFTTVLRFVFARPIIFAPLAPAIAHALVEGTAFIGAAITGAILAGLNIGAIAAGIALIADDPRVVSGFNALKSKASSTFKGLAEVFIEPLLRSFVIFEGTIERIAPNIQRIFVALAPSIEKLAAGLAGLVENALPGIERAIVASIPLLDMLAKILPEVGRHIDSFFTKLSDPQVVEGATAGLKDAITLFLYFMDVVGSLLASLSRAWTEFRPILADIKDLLDSLGISGDTVAASLSVLGTTLEVLASGGLNQFRTALEGVRAAIDLIPEPLKGVGLQILEFTGIVDEKGEADKKAKEDAEAHAAAIQELQVRIEESQGGLVNYKDALTGVASEANHLKARHNDLLNDLGALENFYTTMADGASDSEEKAKAFAEALREVYEEAQNLEQKTQDWEASFDSFQETFREGEASARDNSRAIEENNQKIGELDQQLRSGEITMSEYNREVGALKDENAELSGSLSESAKSLDIKTEAGRKGRDALKELATATREETTAMIASGTPYDDAIANHNERIDAIRKEAQETGLNAEETDKLIKLYGDIPKSIDTKMTISGADEVIRQLHEIKSIEASMATGKSLAEASTEVTQATARAEFKGFSRASGGIVRGPGTSTSDSIPARLSDGEFVTKAASVNYYGADAMAAINDGRADRAVIRKAATGYANGGLVRSDGVPGFAAGGTVVGNTVIEREFRYTVTTDSSLDANAKGIGERIATKIREGLTGSGSQDASGVGKQIFEEIKKGIEASLPQAIEVGKSIVNKISEGIKSISVGGEAENIGKSIVDSIKKGVESQNVGEQFKELGKTIIQGLFDGINESIGGANIGGMAELGKKLITDLVAGINGSKQDVTNAWSDLATQVTRAVSEMNTEVQSIWGDMKSFLDTKMSEIRTATERWLNTDIKNIWETGWKTTNDILRKWIEEGRKGADEGYAKIKNSTTSLKNHIIGEFNGIAGGIVGGINNAIDVLNKAIDAVNKILPKDIAKIGKVSGPSNTGGAPRGSGNQGFAAANRRAAGGSVSDRPDPHHTGGPITGPGTGTSDDIYAVGPGNQPYYLSNGEHILTAHEVRKLGGHERVADIRRAIRDGKTETAFALGGEIREIRRATGGAVELITALGRKFGAGPVTSSYRSTPDYHGQGKAVDFGGYNQDAAASKFMQYARGLLELIHLTTSGGGPTRSIGASDNISASSAKSSPRRETRYAVKHGTPNYSGYNSLFASGDDSVSHRNHIHVAANAAQAQMILEGKLPKDSGVPFATGGGSFTYVDEAMVKKAKDAMNKALEPYAGIMKQFQRDSLFTNAVRHILDINPIKKAIEDKITEAATITAASGPQAGTGGGDPKVMAAAYAQAKKMDASRKVLLALFETGFVESGFRNLGHLGSRNDHDSLGFLQQRPSSGWGTPSQIMNVPHATASFVSRAKAKEGRYRNAGQLAQAVQISAFPDRYNQHRDQAVHALRGFDPKFDPNGYARGGAIEDKLFNGYNRLNDSALAPTPRTLSRAAQQVVNNTTTTTDRGLHVTYENININNPVPERGGDSIRNRLRRDQLLFEDSL